MNTKKGQGLSLNTVVIAAMVILVLIVVAIIVIRSSGTFANNTGGCSNQGGVCKSSGVCDSGYFLNPTLSASCRNEGDTRTACCMPGDI